MNILETERLYLRRIEPNDALSFYELNSDPEVLIYTGDVPFKNVEESLKFCLNYNHYSQYGFGRWVVVNKINKDFLGWCGLKYSPHLNEYDIGFRFSKKYWNKGYATEAAIACLEMGFTQFKLPMIVGRARIENKASQRVLTKIGLEYWQERSAGGYKECIYRKLNYNEFL